MAKSIGPEDPTPTLCLVMIVRNEGPRMPRLLESLKGIIDEVVISDTGSTDDTIEVTRNYCDKELGIRCVVDETLFKDFGFNRSKSMSVAVKKSSCDFLLFMDADMRLVCGPTFSKRALLGNGVDVMSLMQKGCGLEYYNMRIMRRSLPNLRCVGVTHEHLACDGEHTSSNIPAELVHINDIGDGGSKSDKFPRDYRLLKQGLADEPTNVRYMFYLAETCRHANKPLESIKYYKMRIKAGGWDEEIYRSMYGITMCNMTLNRPQKVDAWAIRAHLFRPSRVESLYAACKWHREKGENTRAYAFYQLGSRIAKPVGDVLFVETAPYIWAWDYEFAILAYYVERDTQNKKTAHLKNPIGSTLCLRRIVSALGTAASCGAVIPEYAFKNMVENIRHYAELLPTHLRRTDVNTPTIPGFTSSTPSVVHLAGHQKLTRIVRHVDYKIKHEDGEYVYAPHGSVNSMYTIQAAEGEEWKTLRIDCTGVPEWMNTRIRGIEDIHIFNLQTDTPLTSSLAVVPPRDGVKVYGIGSSVQYSVDGRAAMIMLEVDLVNSVAYPIKRLHRENEWEKNHSPITGTNLCVHSWGPRLKIYDMVESTSEKLVFTYDFPENEIPGWFRELRGSSIGIPYPSTGTPTEYWFLAHAVHHSKPRRYMHSLVRLDAKTLRPVGFSIPFSFDEYFVEFVGGIALVDGDKTLIASYSVFDSTSREIRIPVPWLLQVMTLSVHTTVVE